MGRETIVMKKLTQEAWNQVLEDAQIKCMHRIPECCPQRPTLNSRPGRDFGAGVDVSMVTDLSESMWGTWTKIFEVHGFNTVFCRLVCHAGLAQERATIVSIPEEVRLHSRFGIESHAEIGGPATISKISFYRLATAARFMFEIFTTKSLPAVG